LLCARETTEPEKYDACPGLTSLRVLCADGPIEVSTYQGFPFIARRIDRRLIWFQNWLRRTRRVNSKRRFPPPWELYSNVSLRK
jgi:hypothetical protein